MKQLLTSTETPNDKWNLEREKGSDMWIFFKTYLAGDIEEKKVGCMD